MTYRIYGVLAVVGLGAFLTARPLFAHHEILAKFDDKKTTTLKGTVTKLDWANPHVHIFMNVQNGNSLANWAVELESPVDLGRGGWTRDSVKPGDALTVQGIAARNGSRQVWANSVVMTNTNKKLFDGANPQKPAAKPPSSPSTKGPDAQTRVRPRKCPSGPPRGGPPPGKTGWWGAPPATSVVQTGPIGPADAYGLLKNIGDVDKVAPFQKWARDLYELRQRNLLKDDPMFLYC